MRFGPDAPECFEAVNLGKHYIQNGQGVVSRKRLANSLGAVRCDVDVKAFRFEIFTEEIAQLDIIVDDQDIQRRCSVGLVRVMRLTLSECGEAGGVILAQRGPGQNRRMQFFTKPEGAQDGRLARISGVPALRCVACWI